MSTPPILFPLAPDRAIIESMQLRHYETIAVGYDQHYNDEWSRDYMQRFVFENMFRDMPLENARVLEAMCGGGQATDYLLERNALVTGLDISPQQAANFKRRHRGAKVICGSVLDMGVPDEAFDVVAVIGGIHHTPPYEIETINEIHRVLRPGGHFCFMEPHSESFAEIFRKTWYKYDPLFAKNEAAVSMKRLHIEFADRFDFKSEHYLGNLGYLLVLNSMVFRIPTFIKKAYSPAILASEMMLNKILGKPFSCFVVGQWQKK